MVILLKLTKKIFNIILIFLLNLLEVFFLIYTTYVLQKVIDNQNNFILYFLLQIIMSIIYCLKTIVFYYKSININKNYLIPIFNNIFNLNKEFIVSHDKKEIGHLLFDAFYLKTIKMEFLFFNIQDLILIIASLTLIFYYSFIIMLIVILSILILGLSLLIILKINRKIFNNKRIAEANFYYDYQKNLEYLDDNAKLKYKNLEIKFLTYLESEQNLLKITLFKNSFIFLFQNIINSLIIFLYLSNFNLFASFGSFLAILNVINFLLNPTLNLLSSSLKFSNYNLLSKKIKELKEEKIV